MRIRHLLLYFLVNLLIGTFVFLRGFFPLSFTSDDRAGYDDLPDFIDEVKLNRSEYVSQVHRLTLMVIDAMRTDFIQNSENTSMRYTNKQLQDSNACLFNIQVESPTVTMPRIKAMTTGTVPNFIDVVLNLGCSELKADSLLHQVHDKNGTIVFAGDNTWVKMFPQMFVRPLENFDSLFVNDFYEGDKNISQKLSAELKRNDWRMLILHFLGLDHIGHVEGPFSAKVPGKLKEMDQNIMHIDLAINEWKKSDHLSNVLLVTGDHGMRDTGGHGGSTHSEINVPLLVFGTECQTDGTSYKQIDIAPTVSVLLGVPIPASSIGNLIPGILSSLPESLRLYALYYNTRRLLDKVVSIHGADSIKDKEIYIQFQEAKKEHKAYLKTIEQSQNVAAFKRAKLLYESISSEMSKQLRELFNKYDEFSIWLGVIYVAIVSACLLLTITSPINTMKFVPKSIALAAIAVSISHFAYCKLIGDEFGSCFSSNGYFSNVIPIVVIFGFMNNIRILSNQLPRIKASRISQAFADMPKISWLLFFGLTFHAISLSSSSFIEEEHQTWYYLSTTLLLLIYYFDWKRLLKSGKIGEPISRSGKTKNAEAPTLLNFISGKNSADRYVWFQSSWIHLFAMHLLARRLNQTGDKWLMVPDIGDWMIMDEHRLTHSFFVFGSLFLMIINCADYGSILTNVLTLTASVLIYYFRTLTGAVNFAGIKKSDSQQTCIILFWLNIFEIFAINFGPVLFRILQRNARKTDYKTCVGATITMTTLISALIHKPHNIFLNALLLITCAKLTVTIRTLFKSQSDATNLCIQCIVHFWMGKCFFFYQGNSNSLASIDLNAGYVGLRHFHAIPVTILLTINTYSGPILSYLLLLYHELDASEVEPPATETKRAHNSSTSERKYTTNIPNILLILSVLIALPFTVYCIVVILFRNHLFVWTVFSPKLLYEVFHLILMSVLFCWTDAFLNAVK